MKKGKIKNHLKQIWEIFEKTGCISAYLLYKEFDKKYVRQKQSKKFLIKK